MSTATAAKPATSTTDPVNENSDLALAATAIFGGASNSFTTRAGKPAVIKPATMKQLPLVLKFFKTVLDGMDQNSVIALVEMYSERQRAAIVAGRNPHQIDIEESTSGELVRKTFGNVSLLAQLLAAASEELPELVAGFTNLTEAEYEALEPSEGMTIVGGIFSLNYGFFTQSCAPILQAFMKSWIGRSPAKSTAATTPSKIIRRR